MANWLKCKCCFAKVFSLKPYKSVSTRMWYQLSFCIRVSGMLHSFSHKMLVLVFFHTGVFIRFSGSTYMMYVWGDNGTDSEFTSLKVVQTEPHHIH